MGAVKELFLRFELSGPNPAIFDKGRWRSYTEFLDAIDAWHDRFPALGIGPGTVCVIHGDYTFESCSLLFALLRVGAVSVPLAPAEKHHLDNFASLAGVEIIVRFAEDDTWRAKRLRNNSAADLIVSFRKLKRPGLVVFTSGSTGEPKAILHDMELVSRKFVKRRQGRVTLLFLLMDHFGGINTLLGALAYGGGGVCLPNRSPETVCRLIDEANVQLLPTTPTFLNLLFLYECWKHHDLSSIELITYGAESMPQRTLDQIHQAFPAVQLKQTYGLSELGVLRSTSESNDTLWVKIGGEGFETKIIDNILWVRSESNMVGYLSAPSPFDEDGWYCTGDEVEVKGDFVRFLGRKSDVINVGGQKVFPAEVEAMLLEADNVDEVMVYGVRHPILGQVPVANLSLAKPEDEEKLSRRLRRFCKARMNSFKIPMRFTIAEAQSLPNKRFKKKRPNEAINSNKTCD